MMRKITTMLVTGGGIAAMSLAAMGVASASETAGSSTPVMGKVVAKTTTHTDPFLAADKLSTLYPGSEVEVRCWVEGQTVHGSDIWFMLGGGLDFAPRTAIEPSASVPSCLP
jgi:hypothetical protein